MTLPAIPARVMFDACLTVRKLSDVPELDGRMKGWTDRHRLPALAGLDGRPTPVKFWAGWHETGLYLACRNPEGDEDPACERDRFWTGDGVRLWLDTRDNRAAHRASRFCRQYVVFTDDFTARQAPVPMAKQDAPAPPADAIKIAGKRGKGREGGWQFELGLTTAALPDFDPVEHRRLGFCYYVKDAMSGDQWLTLGGQFPYYSDPSLWATLELAD